MLQSSIPPKFPIPWGNSANVPYIRSIPVASQIGIQNGAASLTDGFPPLTFTPELAGGTPPFGEDWNGVLKQITQWCQWFSAGAPIYYDSAFSTAIGGYPNGTMLSSAIVPGYVWLSIADNNTSNPDAGGANWVQAPGQVPTGTPVQSLSSTVPYGYVPANALTVGNPSSNATNRANADTQFLFSFLWNFPATTCPIYTSAGSASTRGASAAADYVANKAIAVPNMKGLGLMGVDTMGGASSTFLTGVPITSGDDMTPGSILGENLHQLTASQLPTITPTFSGTNQSVSVTSTANFAEIGGGNPGLTGSASLGITQATVTSTGTFTPNGTVSSFGSNATHNTVPRSALVFWNLKL